MSRIPVGRRQELPPLPRSLLADPLERLEVYMPSYRALAVAVLAGAVTHDPAWFNEWPGAARFWADLAGIGPDAFAGALARWQAGQPVA